MGRSKAVRADLVMRGIDAARIEATGMGETAPIATNDTEEGRAQNRRVEFEITDTKGSDIQQIYE
jgi:OOP family OmpA-OmpF porin